MLGLSSNSQMSLAEGLSCSTHSLPSVVKHSPMAGEKVVVISEENRKELNFTDRRVQKTCIYHLSGHYVEMRFHRFGQAGLELTSSDTPTSASQSSEITGVRHQAWVLSALFSAASVVPRTVPFIYRVCSKLLLLNESVNKRNRFDREVREGESMSVCVEGGVTECDRGHRDRRDVSGVDEKLVVGPTVTICQVPSVECVESAEIPRESGVDRLTFPGAMFQYTGGPGWKARHRQHGAQRASTLMRTLGGRELWNMLVHWLLHSSGPLVEAREALSGATGEVTVGQIREGETQRDAASMQRQKKKDKTRTLMGLYRGKNKRRSTVRKAAGAG
ncbi:Protein GVQW1 [Plecturocebus cupreus]